jgi:23S rRNA (cytidine1920-2'-O)/16S rRNA (cytidine1409-2'-O)-methyltransferase
VSADEVIALMSPGPRFVGRGGEKLDAALERFSLDVTGMRAVDAGASTGGFTDCLLHRGAAAVAAIDVGYGQLHEKLRADPRVRVLERTDIRDATPDLVGWHADIVVADLSFISLRLVLEPLLGLAAPGAWLVLLVKPQFEAGKREADRGRGVIRNPAIWRRVLREVIDALDERGATIMGCMASPITGAEGNVEFLVVGRAPQHSRGAEVTSPQGALAGGGRPDLAQDSVIDSMIDAAVTTGSVLVQSRQEDY